MLALQEVGKVLSISRGSEPKADQAQDLAPTALTRELGEGPICLPQLQAHCQSHPPSQVSSEFHNFKTVAVDAISLTAACAHPVGLFI